MMGLRRIVWSVVLVLLCESLWAQDAASYFIDSSVVRMNHNAAFAPGRGYFNIPVLGNMSLSTNGNLSMSSLLYSVDGELVPLFDTRISADRALSGLGGVNTLGVDGRLSILGFGAYCKDRTSFWNFDLALRSSSNMSMPYELFEFVKRLPERAEICDVDLYLESYVEAAFGYSTKVDDRLTIGGRVKFLAGLANASLKIDQLDVTLMSDRWLATAQGSLDVNMSGVQLDSEDGVFEVGDITLDNFSGVAGYGAAVDLGAAYSLTDHLELSLSANDLGFVVWREESNLSGDMLDQFSFSGVNVDVDGDQMTSETDVDLDELKYEQTPSHSSTKWLQANLNLGAEYGVWGDRIGVGALYTARLWRTKVLHSVTTVARFTPIEWFSMAASYAITNNRANAVGFAANIATGFVNLYVATDVLVSRKSAQYIPIDQSAMNLTLGLAVPMGRRGERKYNCNF